MALVEGPVWTDDTDVELVGSEYWTPKKEDEKRIHAFQMWGMAQNALDKLDVEKY